jgi:hypothetical protein
LGNLLVKHEFVGGGFELGDLCCGLEFVLVQGFELGLLGVDFLHEGLHDVIVFLQRDHSN